jgi:N-acetylmuramoyl-L-alanine amidase
MIFFRSLLCPKTLVAISLFLTFLFFPCSVSSQQNKLIAKSATAILDGKQTLNLKVYIDTNSTHFFSIKDIAKIYNASFEWKPISSIVTMIINNQKVDFTPDDKTVLFGRDPKTMKTSSRLVSNNVYIPLEVLMSKDFAQITQINASWNATNLSLNLDYIPNITSIKYLTNRQETKVMVQIPQSLSYTVSKSSLSITLRIMRGKVENQTIQIDNGAIKTIVSNNDAKVAQIKINLAQPPLNVKASKSKAIPETITISMLHSKPLDIIPLQQDSNNRQTPATIPLSPIERGIDNSDLAKAPVEKFDASDIKDDTSSIVDDISSFRDLATAVIGKKNKNAKTIIIDAGHGGTDPGAIGPGGLKEKDIALEIAYELKKLFDRNKDFNPVLTRKDDVFIPLAERTHIANERHADLFISIHCNANINRKVGGFEVFFLAERATDAEAIATANLENSVIELEGKPSEKLANIQRMLWSMMQNEYLNESSELSSFISAVAPGKLKIQNRGVKQAGFYVLRGTQMPAILVEAAFISNYAEEAKLKTREFQRATAQAIYEGVIRYYDRKNKQNGKK